MGYCVRLSGQQFRIPASKINDCLDNILATNNKWLTHAVNEAAKNIKYFAHIPANLKFIELVDYVWGFTFTQNKDNDIDNVSYNLENMHDFDGFCNSIAPCVESGSYLEFTGEDSTKWRYVFRDGKWKEVRPNMIWLDE